MIISAHVLCDPGRTLYTCVPVPSTVIDPIPSSAVLSMIRLFFTANFPEILPSLCVRLLVALIVSPADVVIIGFIPHEGCASIITL